MSPYGSTLLMPSTSTPSTSSPYLQRQQRQQQQQQHHRHQKNVLSYIDQHVLVCR
jgi:hypothetical protein